MSLITDPSLQALWSAAQSSQSEWSSRTFWNHLLSKFIFPEKSYIVASEEPPSESLPRNRIDIVIKYIGANKDIRILCFVESKRPKAPPSLVDEVERQAFDACVAYTGENPNLTSVYALTTVGTKARAWIYTPPSDYLDPLFGTQNLSDINEYVEASGNDATKLTMAFNQMRASQISVSVSSQQNQPGKQIQSTPSASSSQKGKQPLYANSFTLTNKPASVASSSKTAQSTPSEFAPTLKNEVELSKLTHTDGRQFYRWKLLDGTFNQEWATISKWLQVRPIQGKVYFQNLDHNIWSRECKSG